jgi:cytochrome oxidase Cu insertion factor (SCO1/SenC/PrrC family)
MTRPAIDMEPAVRDPKKLWTTAGILVLVAAVGGVLVLMAYQKTVSRQEAEDRAPFLTRLEKNFAVVRQDGSAAGLLDLAGDVWLLAPVSVEDPALSERSVAALQKMDAVFAQRSDVHFVLITVDPDNEGPDKLAAFGKQRGMELPRWWLSAAGKEFTHTFLKNQLRFGMMPARGVDGKWVYDPAIKLISRGRHVRGSFDFNGAAAVDARMVADGKAPEYVAALEKLLERRIDELLAESQKQ